jgi:hypothetical protein
VVDAEAPWEAHPQALAFVAEWIDMALRQNPNRSLFHIIWRPGDARIIYNLEDRELLVISTTSGRSQETVLARDVDPADIGRVSSTTSTISQTSA